MNELRKTFYFYRWDLRPIIIREDPRPIIIREDPPPLHQRPTLCQGPRMTPPKPTIRALAFILHEAGRRPVNAGQTLAATLPQQLERDKAISIQNQIHRLRFVEWSALAEHVREGRQLTAGNLLNLVMPVESGCVSCTISAAELAAHIHDAERDAVERRLTLNAVDRPWLTFDDLPEPARLGRLKQAEFLLDVFGAFVEFGPVSS